FSIRRFRPGGVNPRGKTRRDSRNDQLTRQMNRRAQERKSVAKDGAREHCAVAAELLVTIGAEALSTANLEHRLGSGVAENRARIAPSEELERSDLVPRGGPQLHSLPAELTVRSLVMDSRTDTAIDKQTADLR